MRLEEPGLASLPRDASAAAREALALRIEAQQDEVMAALRTLGAVELARVGVQRSALAVRLPRTQLGAARRLSGVQSVQPVQHVQREPPLPPAQ